MKAVILLALAYPLLVAAQFGARSDVDYGLNVQPPTVMNASAAVPYTELPLHLLRRATCASGLKQCQDGSCYNSTVVCCSGSGACASNQQCCSPDAAGKICVPAGSQCCKAGGYCWKGNDCYIVSWLSSSDLCCTDSGCSAYVGSDGVTSAATYTYSSPYTYFWYSYYYSATYLTYVTSTFRTVYTVTAVGLAGVESSTAALKSSIAASLTDPAHTTPKTTPAATQQVVTSIMPAVMTSYPQNTDAQSLPAVTDSTITTDVSVPAQATTTPPITTQSIQTPATSAVIVTVTQSGAGTIERFTIAGLVLVLLPLSLYYLA